MSGKEPQVCPVPLGEIEPHAGLLAVPPDGQLLYKIMTVENFLRSVRSHYLHFNRVDRYDDRPDADEHDSQQLPTDKRRSELIRFEKAPQFSAADYYNLSRARTYACCFSLVNLPYIWDNYGTDSTKGKVCVIFVFGKLRATLNRTLQSGGAVVLSNGKRCCQIFSVDYGNIRYVHWATEQAIGEYLPNPIAYTYMKDVRFSEENEFRISLSALGLGQFIVANGRPLNFPPDLHLGFDFRGAIADGTIHEILRSPETDTEFLAAELKKLGMNMRDGGANAMGEKR